MPWVTGLAVGPEQGLDALVYFDARDDALLLEEVDHGRAARRRVEERLLVGDGARDVLAEALGLEEELAVAHAVRLRVLDVDGPALSCVSWGWGARFSESIAAGCLGPIRRSAAGDGPRGVRRPGPRAMRATGARGEAARPRDILRSDAAVIREALADGARRLVGGEDTLARRRDGLRVQTIRGGAPAPGCFLKTSPVIYAAAARRAVLSTPVSTLAVAMSSSL